jgi:hypothetical protein
MRALCASAGNQQATAPAAASASGATLSSTALQLMQMALPDSLMSMIWFAADIAMDAMDKAKLPVVAGDAAATDSYNSSGSSLALHPQVPFLASLLLTALKCAAVLRAECPKLTIQTSGNISCNRINSPANARAHKAATASADDLRKLNAKEMIARMRAVPEQFVDPWLYKEVHSPIMDRASDVDMQTMMQMFPDDAVRAMLTFGVPAAAAAEHVNRFGRRFGSYASAQEIVAGRLVTFAPGGVIYSSSSSSSAGGSSSSSSSNSTVFWYNAQEVSAMTPWLTVAARSLWLTGQTLSELLPGGSISSSGGSSSRSTPLQAVELLLNAGGVPMPKHPDACAEACLVDAAFFLKLLELAYSCVEWLGSQLCHMRLPGDEPAADGSSEEERLPLLQRLLERHAQLQQELFAALERCVAGRAEPDRQCDVCSAAAALLVQRMWGDSLPGQLSAFGAAVAAALPVGWACNNAACTNLGTLSDLQLVRGKAKVCAGCKQVRLCSAECQRQHWKAGHKKICKALAAAPASSGDLTWQQQRCCWL